MELFLSEDRTTAFLASPIVEPGPVGYFMYPLASSVQSQVVTMISAVDEIMGEFDLEKFYQPPKAHLSLAWTTIDVEVSLLRVHNYLQFSGSHQDEARENSYNLLLENTQSLTISSLRDYVRRLRASQKVSSTSNCRP